MESVQIKVDDDGKLCTKSFFAKIINYSSRKVKSEAHVAQKYPRVAFSVR